MSNTITITLIFLNSIRQDLTFNDTFLQANNLPYSNVQDITVADIIAFLITNWQPQWGQTPVNIASVRFIQQGRALRTGLAIGDLNLSKSNVFHVNMRPMSLKETGNKRASLLVPTSHNKRTTRTFSNNGQPLTVNTTDDINFQMNPNGTTTLVGSANDINSYYTDRYGLSAVGNRMSAAAALGGSPGNRNSYLSTGRATQRYSYMEPTTGSSSRSYSINRNYHRYSDDTSDDDDDIPIDDPAMLDDIDGIMSNPNGHQQLDPNEFHHIITTDKGRRELEARREAELKQQQAETQYNQLQLKQRQLQANKATSANQQPRPNGGNSGCCIIM